MVNCPIKYIEVKSLKPINNKRQTTRYYYRVHQIAKDLYHKTITNEETRVWEKNETLKTQHIVQIKIRII